LPPLVHAFYTLAGAWPIKLAGIIVLFSDAALYHYPGAVTLPGLSTVAGVRLGSMLVWTLGGFGYTLTAFWLMRRWLSRESKKPPLPVSSWSTDDAMRAPGLDS
jgi:cytochrome c oxidase assembly factor CtaG